MTEVTSTVRAYPGIEQRTIHDDVERIVEEIQVLGYSILEGVMSRAEAAETHDQLVVLWERQEQEFGRERLLELGEHGTHRGLLREDDRYLRMAANPAIMNVIHRLVGETAILNLQNASAAFPHVQHFQSAFHRDFAKDFIASKPLSVNAFWCIDDFNEKSGGTQVVPFSHAIATLPSDAYIARHSITIEAPAGSVIFWDSLLLHRTGYNSSDRPRFGINHMYTRPFLKQQMDFPEYLKGRIDPDSKLGQLLGFWTIPPKSVKEFRVDPDARTYRRGQG